MMKKKPNIYDEMIRKLKEEDKKYGNGDDKYRLDVIRRDRRPLKNLKKVWEDHPDNYDEIDDFFSR